MMIKSTPPCLMLCLSLVLLPIIAAMTAGCGSSDSDGSDADRCTALESSEQLAGGITLDEACYIVGQRLRIDDGELVVDPGTTIYFDSDAGLTVQGTARLTVQGDADSQAVLRGQDDELGLWRGIQLQSVGPHRIDQALIAHGGGRLWDIEEHLTRGGIVVSDEARLEVSNSRFEFHEYAAITSASESASLSIASSEFTDNDYPLRLHGDHIAALSQDLSISQNRNQAILVHGTTPVVNDATWRPLSVPYRIGSALPIHGALTIEAGTELYFERHAGLDIDEGSLVAQGSDETPIRFLGRTDTPGFWRGLRFRNSHHTDNLLSHVEVRHGGSERWDPMWSDSQANILVDDGGHLTINHVEMTDGDYHGISTRDAVVEGCEQLLFRDNRRHDSHSYEGDEICF